LEEPREPFIARARANLANKIYFIFLGFFLQKNYNKYYNYNLLTVKNQKETLKFYKFMAKNIAIFIFCSNGSRCGMPTSEALEQEIDVNPPIQIDNWAPARV
jgi:hypothetical protein